MSEIPDASAIPDVVADDELLHRRIHPTFVKPDGSVSSQAFTDPEMSVDRANYWSVALTLRGYDGFGITALGAAVARDCQQEVIAAKELLNPAHALVKGRKTKSIARTLAKASQWVVGINAEGERLSAEEPTA